MEKTRPPAVVSTATLAMSNDRAGAGDLVNITDLVPGDTVTRQVTITNTGNAGFTYVASASPASNTLLWSDTTNGLQVAVMRGETVVYTGALKDLSLPASAEIAPAATDTLTFEFSLPATADNSFQGLTQTFTVTYTATQLAGRSR